MWGAVDQCIGIVVWGCCGLVHRYCSVEVLWAGIHRYLVTCGSPRGHSMETDTA